VPSAKAVRDRKQVPRLCLRVAGSAAVLRIARKGIESSERLGHRRWVIERTISWMSGHRRLNHRHERHPRSYLAFLGLAAAICCYRRLLRPTM
jgi:transposase